MTKTVELIDAAAINLARDLVQAGNARLLTEAWDLKEQEALTCIWEIAFRSLLESMLVKGSASHVNILANMLAKFLELGGVAAALIDLLLTGQRPDLVFLRRHFESLESNDLTSAFDFSFMIESLIHGLVAALTVDASLPSPLRGRVAIERVALLYSFLRTQVKTLSEIDEMVFNLEQQIRATAKYNVHFWGTAKNIVIGDMARLQVAPDLQPALERALNLLDAMWNAYAQLTETEGLNNLGVHESSRIRMFIAQLFDPDDDTRLAAAQALGYLCYPCTRTLARRLRVDSNPIVRYWLAYALGQIRTAEACAALAEAQLTELNPFAQLGITDALQAANCSGA